MGGMALLLVMWAFAQLKETLPLEEREPLHPVTLFRNYMEVFKNGRFNVIALAVSCNFGAVFIYIAAAPEFLMRELGLQETEFYWLFGPATFGMMTGSWLSGRLAGRITRRATIRLSFVILIVAAVANVILSFAIPPQIPWSVLPLYFYGAGIALAMPSMTLSGLEIFHERRGLAASCQSFLMTSLSTVVASILAPLTGGEPRRLACAGALLLAAGALGTLYFFSGGHYLPEEMLDGNSEA
jgi:DHA1 family bicyclomycin/chloramphenicol resistance-like MFS transporter